ncbi:MAG: hypothetical protein J3Q66DRAFT_358938 [Benniella sp.]|nr:MAG: hypothetical protein J3Q66DRAFT_358938 [Benniella sp.]
MSWACRHRTVGITDRPVPKNTKDIMAFLGLINYYRRPVPQHARTAVPLTSLHILKKRTPRSNLPARPTITECMNEYNAPTNHVHDMSDQSSGLVCPVCPQRVAGTIQHELGNLPTTLIISLTQQWECQRILPLRLTQPCPRTRHDVAHTGQGLARMRTTQYHGPPRTPLHPPLVQQNPADISIKHTEKDTTQTPLHSSTHSRVKTPTSDHPLTHSSPVKQAQSARTRSTALQQEWREWGWRTIWWWECKYTYTQEATGQWRWRRRPRT